MKENARTAAKRSLDYGEIFRIMRLSGMIAIITAAALLSGMQAAAEEKGNEMERDVRKPVVAGTFYPGDPEVLRKTVAKLLDDADPDRPAGEIMALVSPHAGYVYSGPVAAYGYKLVSGFDYETVVVISPSHTEYFDFSSVYGGDYYSTPLGEIPIDHEVSNHISSSRDNIRISDKGHISAALGRGEHSLEVQLPFLQETLSDFGLVAIVMGDQSEENIESLASALAKALKGRRALIVASCDLSHFHSSRAAEGLDGVFADLLADLDVRGLYRALADKSTEACGGGPVIAAARAAMLLGADRCKILRYAHSGNVTGDDSNVVGYLSAAVYKEDPGLSEGRKSEKKSEGADSGARGPDSELTDEDRVFLLRLARKVIESHFDGSKIDIEQPSSGILEENRGAFVTLKKDGKLRGCIGYIQAFKPLSQTVVEMASAAAFKDYRFPSVKSSEVGDLAIEISVLSPVEKIDDPRRIEVGKHGLIITRGGNRGLLLPQVPVEWGWDREEFLTQTCLKAGLPGDAWKKDGTVMEVFSAEVFSEGEMGIR